MLKPLSSARQGSFHLVRSPAFFAFIKAFSVKVCPFSSGAILVSSETGKKEKLWGLKILLNSLTLFLFCVANIIFILTPLQQQAVF